MNATTCTIDFDTKAVRHIHHVIILHDNDNRLGEQLLAGEISFTTRSFQSKVNNNDRCLFIYCRKRNTSNDLIRLEFRETEHQLLSNVIHLRHISLFIQTTQLLK